MPLQRFSSIGAPVRVFITRALGWLGLSENAFLGVLAVIIGIVTAGAALAFHELIGWIRDLLYVQLNARFDLYGPRVWMLIVLPAAGGLAVGVIAHWIVRAREGHGIVDVLESVIRSRGIIKPIVAVEKIVTSAITIGSGGSAGAEGPIVQIGASIASGVGQIFRIMRQAMPLLIGCGAAAGISAIFNSPLGGVLFALEVVLHDFSIRAFTPVVLASVVANVTTRAIYRTIHHAEEYQAIFTLPNWAHHWPLQWGEVGNFLVLGILCGLAGVALTRAMYWSEERFARLRFPAVFKPALGGAMLGIMGMLYVMLYGWALLGKSKPFEFGHYPMPAFFGDGYGVIRQLLEADFYRAHTIGPMLLVVSTLVLIKVVATCLSLGSGGSGGIIAPSLFLGAAAGASLALVLQMTGLGGGQPEMYALAGMGAVLGAVVHAPLAAILILFDVTRDDKVILPGMLATITATGVARMIFRDSIYTLALRRRGVQVGGSGSVLHRLLVEQVELEPATVVESAQPLEKVIEMADDRGGDVVVMDDGQYAGMITSRDLQVAMWQREAIPLLTAGDLVRPDIPVITASDDLAAVLDAFSRLDVSRLPVSLPAAPDKIIGLISRAGLLKRYHRAVSEGV